MRKLVIALIIVLPMVFVLVLFSSANLVSISVKVSVNGIQILADGERLPEGEAMPIDMADMKDHTVTAEVTPANAYERGYTLESDNEEVLTVDSEGYITALSEGTANVKATSKDKGFTASIPVVVTSSKAYGVDFSLYDSEGSAVKMNFNKNSSTYTVVGDIAAGTYTYKVDIKGGDSKAYTLKAENDMRALINEGEGSVMFPFSGAVSLKIEVPDAIKNGMLNQTLERTVNIDIAKAQSSSGIIVNGVPDGNTVLLAKGADKATMYVECEGEPELTGEGIAEAHCVVHNAVSRAANDNCHKLEVTLAEGFRQGELNAELKASGKSVPVKLSFAKFDFNLRAPIMREDNEGWRTVILKDTDTTVYAVPAVGLQDVKYVWTADKAALTLTPSADGAMCSFNAREDGEYTVTVQAVLGGENLGAPKRLGVTVTTKVNSVWINNSTNVDLAERYTVGGKKFAENGEIVDNDSYAIKIMVSKKGSAPRPNDYDGIDVVSSDENIATVTMRNGMACLDIKGDGAIEVTARWKYNEEFGGKAVQTIKLNVVKDAVEVSNYPELRTATENGYKVVLTSDIMLGSDKSGQELPLDERRQIVEEHKYNSTYNVAWYAQKNALDKAQVMYALEFTNDVYGNGKYLDAEYFTNAVDASGRPLIFTGPLSFVSFGEEYSAARVAAQDNCAFLIRTDGIKLYGVNLRGCSDESLYEGDKYELNHLNYVGTTLEINADCEIINCRLQNGRNVVRAYGGNRETNFDPISYYINSVPNKDIEDEDRIIVNIRGCILTQSREFIVKVGTNRAIKGSRANTAHPELRNENGVSYKEKTKSISVQDDKGNVNPKTVGTNQYEITNEQFFYDRYVMTDFTLEDSVLETSGLFCIGVESNFSGEVLTDGCSSSIYANKLKQEGWANSGGTSFASMLRLVGDVRMYDWKDVSQVDSSTLIESGNGSGDPLSGILSFNISAMLQEVDGQDEYANLLYKTEDNKTFVHGGIAYYGGGRNYSMIDLSEFKTELNDLSHININIEQFSTSGNSTTSKQTHLLPLASGTHDFNFWLYAADSDNNYAKQESDIANGTKYTGIQKIALFAE